MIIPMDAPRREEGEEVNENNQNEVYNLTKWNKYSNANLKSNGGDINDYVVSIPSMNGIEHMYVNARASGVDGIVIDGEVMDDDDDEDNAVGQRKSKRNSKAKAKAKMSAKEMSDDSAEEDDDEDDSQLSDSGDNSKKRKRSKSYIPWTVHEDRILLDSQKDMGNNWVEIAKLIPGRSRLDVKSRHRSLMRAFKRIWKPEEDKIILDYHALYKSDWVDRASIAIHRSRNAVRVRFKELVENRISHKGRHSLQHGSPNQVFYDKNSNSNNNNNNNNNSHNGNIMGLPDHGSSNSNISNWIGNIDKVQVHTIQQRDQDPSQVHVNTCSNSLDHATFAVIPNFHEQSQIIPFQIPLATQQMIQNSGTAVFLPLDPSQYASLQGIPVVSVPYLPMFNVPVDPNQQNIPISNGNTNKSNESKSNLARTLTPASSISTLSFPSQTTQVELSQSTSNPKSSIVSSANSQKQSQPPSSENAPNLDDEDVNNLLQCLL